MLECRKMDIDSALLAGTYAEDPDVTYVTAYSVYQDHEQIGVVIGSRLGGKMGWECAWNGVLKHGFARRREAISELLRMAGHFGEKL